MGLFKRIAGILGFSKDDNHHDLKSEDEDILDSDNHHHNNNNNQAPNRVHIHETGLPRKGFAVPVHVSVNRPQPGPLLLPSTSGDGGVQGLRWYAKRLRVDEDGDVAEQFIDEVLPDIQTTTEDHRKPFPRFQINNRNRPAKVENQIILQGGKIQQCVEYQGRLQWV